MNVPQAIELAMAHHRRGDLAQATSIYQRVLDAAPDHPDASHLLGLVAHQSGRNGEALRRIQRAITLRNDAPFYHHNLGLVLLETGRYSEAVASAQRAIHLAPEAPAHHNQLGIALLEIGRLGEASTAFQRAFQLKPDSAASMNNLGVALFELGRLEEAEAWSRRALRQQSDYARPYNNLAMICQARGQYDESLGLLQRAVQLDAAYVDARLNRALLWLLRGDFPAGWTEYEWRARRRGQPRHECRLDVWQGEPLGGRTILVHGEQGLGDEIMFASCLGDVVRQAARCVVQCDARLVPLLSRSFPKARVLARGNWNELDRVAAQTGADLHIAAGSLPRYLREGPESFPGQAYLQADPRRVDYWRRRLAGLGEGLNVGIAWRAGKSPREQRLRSLPPRQWDPLTTMPAVRWIDLQYGSTAEQRNEFSFADGSSLVHFDALDPLREQDDFAALVAALDLVISVDNATVHLAAALGTPTWALLPFDPEWRWMLTRRDSLWYGSVRLFRQPRPGDWEGTLAGVQSALSTLMRRECRMPASVANRPAARCD